MWFRVPTLPFRIPSVNASYVFGRIRAMNLFIVNLTDQIANLYTPLFYLILGIFFCLISLALLDLIILGNSNTKPPWDILLALIDISIIILSIKFISGSIRRRKDVDPNDDFVRARVGEMDGLLERIEQNGFAALLCGILFCQCDNLFDRLTSNYYASHESDIDIEHDSHPNHSDDEEGFFETQPLENRQYDESVRV